MTTPDRPAGDAPAGGHAVAAKRESHSRRRTQGMSIGFSIGSALFALGAVFSIASWGPANATFALGSIFFTLAAALQWRAAADDIPPQGGLRKRARVAIRNPDWTSAVVQLLGTLYFNVMTFHAILVTPISTGTFDHEVWRPDAIGSILFLLSSAIAMHPVSRARRHGYVKRSSLYIVWGNMAGSVFFAISALGARATSPGELGHPGWNNWGTLLGGLAFLFASVLLWPQKDPT